MQELTMTEVDEVSGGVAALLVIGLYLLIGAIGAASVADNLTS